MEGALNPRPFGALSLMEVVMMTPVLTTEAFAALGAPNLVYVRPIKAAEILANTPAAQIQSFELDPDQTLYAVHALLVQEASARPSAA